MGLSRSATLSGSGPTSSHITDDTIQIFDQVSNGKGLQHRSCSGTNTRLPIPTRCCLPSS
ncbi:uncharacterized protein M421DRAFT_414964 [Didymella exigua CBS 183.55]|uniref:Uncharacterized protein n=1 Tax=Didymella exigua CBS 183.55 TaxID=1150837 RepID=A0A6A5S2D8_9PLEO|nr:uncharacterized protein M421DRAFT_414964 [Didymella exigua CBS 183.55]KAF1933909.1 hypothetical protein M421DRAFT_414964 [Didymella exigua CBS 183.55]